MQNQESSEKIREVIWCDHVHITTPEILGLEVNYFILHKAPVHMVIEEQKIKLVCPSCFLKGLQRPVVRES